MANATTHYYSVNDGGTQQANYANDGATGVNSVASGVAASASGLNATAVGQNTIASGASSVALGSQAVASGQGATATGSGATAWGVNATAYGDQTKATANGATVIGNNSTASATGAVAIGDHATASNANSVALGSGSTTSAPVNTASTTINGQTYNFAGTNATSTVSVGSAGAERTITNVAAGRVSATSTDAINGSQLYATNQAVQAVASGAVGVVTYDKNSDGSLNHNSATIGSTTNGQVVLHNVGAGSAGTDAVNVNQLNSAIAGEQRQINNLHNEMDDNRRDLYGAVAGAIAMSSLPQAYLPGKSMAAAGLGNSGGESALAVGVSTLSDNGRWVMKLNGSVNTRSNYGVGVGVGFQFD
jgi:autotransporter adhesin